MRTRPTNHRHLLCSVSISLLLAGTALAQFNSGSDGSDGEFSPTESIEVDLSQAVTTSWDTPSPDPGKGIYDSQQWAVVFKYTTINIPAGVNVTFKSHPSGAPVVWLASGNVTIAGDVILDGENGKPYSQEACYSEPGPGGFRGGVRRVTVQLPSSAGFGPGGGAYGHAAGGASYGTSGGNGVWHVCGNGDAGQAGSLYGNASVLPLIGGSGGGGSKLLTGSYNPGGGGGAGGGAILIASSGDVLLEAGGGISASGGAGKEAGGGGGSAGAIRIIANTVAGDGTLRAIGGSGDAFLACELWGNSGGSGGKGRIRVEAEIQVSLSDPGDPNWTTSTPGPIFPPDHAPKLRVTSIDDQTPPDDPVAGVLTTDVDINNDQPVTVHIEAMNIPSGTTVTVIVTPARGNGIEVVSEPLAGSFVLSTATAQVTFPAGRSEIQLKANWTPSP